MVERKSLGDLLAETPQLIVGLIKAEIQHLKDEIAGKAAGVGAGLGVLGGAAFVAIFLFGWLLVAGFEGLNVVFPPWLSALLVSAFLLLVAGILALIGIGLLKKNKDFSNLEAVDSIKHDVNMVRGVGYAAEGRNPLDDLPTTNGDLR